MPANTTRGYPYPLGTDPVADGDDAIRLLAEAVDTKLGILASGTVSIAVSPAAQSATAAVTFPAGRFSAAPIVCVTQAGFGTNWYCVAGSITAAGFNMALVYKDNATNTTAALPCHWIARLGA